MATSPTVLVSGSSAPVSAPTAAPVKFPIVPLLIAVIVGILIAGVACGGVMYYLVRSGKLPTLGSAAVKDPSTPVGSHVMMLDPLLVNLADSGGNSYLRVALTLRVADANGNKGTKPKEAKVNDGNEVVAAVRDTTLMVLGRQTAEGLMAPNGKEQLKTELKSALAERNADLKVLDVFFTDFLVQR
jgi:flagellar FliL protein